MVNDGILEARERRRDEINKLAKFSNVLTVKANVPGFDKNLFISNVLISYFCKLCVNNGANVKSVQTGLDGTTVFCTVEDGVITKDFTSALEENHPIGRFIDLDVTLKDSDRSLSRREKRKCFLCDQSAFVCGRNKTHGIGELIKFLTEKSRDFFIKLISKLIEESVLFELDIEDKFGLVTPKSNGSHSDLTYDLMKASVTSFKEELAKAFFVGVNFESFDKMKEPLIKIGKSCEEKMLKATNGSNSYKGFIFVGGALLCSVGYTLKKLQNFDRVFENVKNILNNFEQPKDTFGYKAINLGFKNALINGKEGFVAVKKALERADRIEPIQLLKYILKNTDDTVLLKRAGSVKRYNHFKSLITNCSNDALEQISVSNICIENGISIGGSADLLIACMLMKKIKENFYFKED